MSHCYAGDWYYVKYNGSVFAARCVAKHEDTFIFKPRWSFPWTKLIILKDEHIIQYTRDPRWAPKIKSVLRSFIWAINPFQSWQSDLEWFELLTPGRKRFSFFNKNLFKIKRSHRCGKLFICLGVYGGDRSQYLLVRPFCIQVIPETMFFSPWSPRIYTHRNNHYYTVQNLGPVTPKNKKDKK